MTETADLADTPIYAQLAYETFPTRFMVSGTEGMDRITVKPMIMTVDTANTGHWNDA